MDKKISVVKISSRGQLVLPKNMREKLDMRAGSTCVVLEDSQREIILIKKIDVPDFEENFNALTEWGSAFVKKHSITKVDLMKEIDRIRNVMH